ncbi:unnamed protein product [Calypogeia fissa]
MVPRVAMDAAHAAAVMVRAHGPDPKGRKMRRHAFFHTESGDTTLSASGFLSLNTSALKLGEEVVPQYRKRLLCATVPSSSVVVVTCASIVEPFLSQQPYGTSPAEARVSPKLIPGAEIDVLVEVLDGKPTDGDNRSQCWIPAHLERVVDIPAAGAALQGLLDVHGGSVDGAWEVGWALAPLEGNSQLQGLGAGAVTARAIVENEPSRRWATAEEPAFSSAATNGVRVSSLSMAATRVAILSLSWGGMEVAASFQDNGFQQASEKYRQSEVSFGLAVASSLKRGDFLLAVGSPFGALSPLHFHNSLSAGIVSNCWPPASKSAALLMADVRCLPGMEGGPVLDERGALVGMLTRPLRQRSGGAEVQLVMTAAVLAPALHHAGVTLGVPCAQQSISFDHNVASSTRFSGSSSSLEADSCTGMMTTSSLDSQSNFLTAPAVAHALKSVVLVTIGDGAWASGVIISKSGLILTNAHLLEPWRFGKMRSAHHHGLLSRCDGGCTMRGGREMKYDHCCSGFDKFGGQECGRLNNDEKLTIDKLDHCHSSSFLSSTIFGLHDSMTQSEATIKPAENNWRGYQRIRVRLDHQQNRSWHNAEAIYVSQGPLDIALLQLISPPPDLSPIVPEESCPPPGSTAIVIGHGLFGPRAELSPSVSAGVVARVVKAGKEALGRAHYDENGESYPMYPAMLQTTAAVHPGGSGGAVVNSLGRMIGLVTSNARHSGGSVIPFLNFSVPYGALAPIFDFASKDFADLTSLAELDRPDKFLSAVWALVPSTPPRPPLQPLPTPQALDLSKPLDERLKGLPKGSRFAQFIAERGAELSLKQQGQSENGQPISQKVFELQTRPTAAYDPQICSRL